MRNSLDEKFLHLHTPLYRRIFHYLQEKGASFNLIGGFIEPHRKHSLVDNEDERNIDIEIFDVNASFYDKILLPEISRLTSERGMFIFPRVYNKGHDTLYRIKVRI